MKATRPTPGIFHFYDGSNMGLVTRDEQGVLVDTGLDRHSARRALHIMEAQDIRLTAVFATHAHADHFGGVQFLQERLQCNCTRPSWRRR